MSDGEEFCQNFPSKGIVQVLIITCLNLS